MTEIQWTGAELNALAVYRHAETHEDAREAEEDLRALVAAREAQAAAKASVLRGHLDVLRKVLFEDAATDHHMRLRKAHAVIQQAEQMEPFENAYASRRAGGVMSIIVKTYDYCPVEVIGEDGYAETCANDVKGWAWYDGGDHDPMLMSACSLHVTDGADSIAAVVAKQEVDRWPALPTNPHRIEETP